MWVSTNTFKVFCKCRKISVCAKCTLEKASTWVHADTCNTQSSVLYTPLLVGAWIGWFCAGTSSMTIRRLGVYITVCAYQNKSLRLPKHIWFWCIGFTNYPFGMCASPFIFATISNKIVQCLLKIEKSWENMHCFTLNQLSYKGLIWVTVAFKFQNSKVDWREL